MTREQLMSNISVTFANSAAADQPEAFVSVPPGYVLISGGFRVASYLGNLGTASFPDSDNATWTARSKDHFVADSTTIRAYAIGLSRLLPDVGFVMVQIENATSSPAVPHPASTAILPQGFAITGGGAEVNYSGVGNLLWKLEPTQTDRQDFTAASKDQVESDPATITSYVLGISIEGAPPTLGDPADGAVGKYYSSGFDATGVPPPAVTLVDGKLPPGLDLHSDGTLTGTPTQAGSYQFSVQAANDVGTIDKTVTVTIGVAPAAPTITGLTNGDGKVSVAFSDTSSGTSPITFYTVTATDDSNADGTRTATGPSSPVEVSGLINGDTYEFTVTASSAFGTSPPSASSGRLNVGVAPTLPADPAVGAVGKSYSSGFDATGAPPPIVTQVSGDRPPGLTLHSDGTLTGTPTQAGSYQFSVQAINDVGMTDKTVTVTISQ